MEKYHFILENIRKESMSGDAYTLAGVKRIFKKMDAESCDVYKRLRGGIVSGTPFMTLYK